MKAAPVWFVLVLCLAGCAGRPKPAAPVPAATKAVPPTEPNPPAQGAAVYVSGNVRTRLILFTDGLTLSRACALAGYQGGDVPRQIVVLRSGQSPITVEAANLRNQDMVLEPGDRIEIRP